MVQTGQVGQTMPLKGAAYFRASKIWLASIELKETGEVKDTAVGKRVSKWASIGAGKN